MPTDECFFRAIKYKSTTAQAASTLLQGAAAGVAYGAYIYVEEGGKQ